MALKSAWTYILEQQDTLQSLLDMHTDLGGVETEVSKQVHSLCNPLHICMNLVCAPTGVSMQVHGGLLRILTCFMYTRGGSASIRILYTYVTSSGDIRYDNWSYVVVIQQKSCARRQILAPSVPSCVHANDLSFKVCVFWVVKGPHSCRERCYCSRWYVRTL